MEGLDQIYITPRRSRRPRIFFPAAAYRRMSPRQAQAMTTRRTVRSRPMPTTARAWGSRAPRFRGLEQFPEQVIPAWMQRLGWGLIITTSALTLWKHVTGR